jgi:hypothetical protein
MTHRIDRTLPHHTALGVVIYTQPRRPAALDDRTPSQIQREAHRSGGPPAPPAGVHTHFRDRGIH